MRNKIEVIWIALVSIALVMSLIGWSVNFNRAREAETRVDELEAVIGENSDRWNCEHSCQELLNSRDRGFREALRWKEMAEQCIAEKLEVKRGGER